MSTLESIRRTFVHHHIALNQSNFCQKTMGKERRRSYVLRVVGEVVKPSVTNSI